jgi:hypothetical protein
LRQSEINSKTAKTETDDNDSSDGDEHPVPEATMATDNGGVIAMLLGLQGNRSGFPDHFHLLLRLARLRNPVDLRLLKCLLAETKAEMQEILCSHRQKNAAGQKDYRSVSHSSIFLPESSQNQKLKLPEETTAATALFDFTPSVQQTRKTRALMVSGPV